MANKPYTDADWLHEQYVEQRRPSTDIAEECDVSATTICDWLERHGIPRRSQREAHAPDKPYTDDDWLREEYVDNGRSMKDIAEECDVSAAVILKWLRRHGIETRSIGQHKMNEPISILYRGGELGDLPGPYELVQSSVTIDGERVHERAYLHQLVAIAEGADPHKVFSDGDYTVHHDNGVRWDNRPANIEFLSGSNHAKHHFEERGGLQPWQDGG